MMVEIRDRKNFIYTGSDIAEQVIQIEVERAGVFYSFSDRSEVRLAASPRDVGVSQVERMVGRLYAEILPEGRVSIPEQVRHDKRKIVRLYDHIRSFLNAYGEMAVN
jgi:hypothetical protein